MCMRACLFCAHVLVFCVCTCFCVSSCLVRECWYCACALVLCVLAFFVLAHLFCACAHACFVRAHLYCVRALVYARALVVCECLFCARATVTSTPACFVHACSCFVRAPLVLCIRACFIARARVRARTSTTRSTGTPTRRSWGRQTGTHTHTHTHTQHTGFHTSRTLPPRPAVLSHP